MPVHVIGPPSLVARLDGWGWSPGTVPAPDAAAFPMAEFRDRFLDAFGAAKPTPGPSLPDKHAAPAAAPVAGREDAGR